MKRLLQSKRTLLLILLLQHFSIHSQTLPQQLDSMLNYALDSMQVVLNAQSLSAAIQYPNDVSWKRATGISQINPVVNVTTDDTYLIGSITKTMIAACVLQLDEEGLLSIDDSISDWLPEIEYVNPDITIRQLLQHQSGIYDVLSNPDCQPALLSNMDSIWDPLVLINTFIQPAIFTAGTSWSYSNTNYFLLGMIIKQATGNPYYEELRTRFFTPLAMNTIAIPAYETLTSPVAHVWMDLNGDQITEDGNFFYMNYLSLNSVAGPAGGYFATPSDISKWMRTYMRGDLLSEASMTAAKTTVTSPGLPGCTYGLGLMKKSFLGLEAYGHGGDLAYSSSSWYFPTRDISITVFTNDSETISWSLVPVISALLKKINLYDAIANGVDETPSISPRLTAYPSPFNNSFTVEMHEGSTYEITLCDAMGKVIDAKQITNTNSSIQFNDMNYLPAGLYFLHVITDEKHAQTLKLMKE